jgi:predicted deacetylase
MHGLTHRMSGRVRNPWQWAWARGFARSQGEFFFCDTTDSKCRLEAARAIFRRAGFESNVQGFVPPAWLLSPEALLALKKVAEFTFYERLTGIVYRDVIHARRLIGFGSLTWPEAHATAGYARLQTLRPPNDTRLAIHPADVARASSVKAIRVTLRRLLDHLEPMNYANFLRHAM